MSCQQPARRRSIQVACPIDGTALQAGERAALRCQHGHSFDRAREGYYNLLVVQHKASRAPGDDQAMVMARRRFLDAGGYAPVAARLIEMVSQATRGMDADLGIVDAGCGEGYYLDAIAWAFAGSANGGFPLAGIDISKWAVRAAAKRNADCFWAVSTNRHLPFRPASVGLILSMFGFPVWESFAAVQPAEGRVLLVDPGPEHLIELRRIIYPVVNATQPPTLDAARRAGFVLEAEQRLRFAMDLVSAAQIADLLTMTPHAHRASSSGRAALAGHSRLTITGDVVFRLLGRTPRH